jgi:hypothetical protein
MESLEKRKGNQRVNRFGTQEKLREQLKPRLVLGFLLLAGVVCVSTGALFARMSSTDPLTTSAYRMTFALVLVFPFGARKLRTEWSSIPLRQLLLTFSAGGFLALQRCQQCLLSHHKFSLDWADRSRFLTEKAEQFPLLDRLRSWAYWSGNSYGLYNGRKGSEPKRRWNGSYWSTLHGGLPAPCPRGKGWYFLSLFSPALLRFFHGFPLGVCCFLEI